VVVVRIKKQKVETEKEKTMGGTPMGLMARMAMLHKNRKEPGHVYHR
jgi:hypothetical protein